MMCSNVSGSERAWIECLKVSVIVEHMTYEPPEQTLDYQIMKSHKNTLLLTVPFEEFVCEQDIVLIEPASNQTER